VRAVQNQEQAAGVAVINVRNWPAWAVAILYALFGMALPLMAAILPEERADLLYHRYEGDQVTVDGPSLLARKSMSKYTSVYANYYTDAVTSASIDVRTSGSEYTEDRQEYSFGADFLVDNSTISAGYTNSEENDYSSNTYHFGISHNMFSELTTVSLGFSYGDDEVRKNLRDAQGNYIGNDPNFGKQPLERRNYRLGLTQIVTQNLIMNLGFEAVADEGYTQNPYRTARIYTPGDLPGPGGAPIPGNVAERYPKTRTSNAYAVRANYYLPYRAAIHSEFKYYTDTWGIKANTFKIGYVHPYRERWTFDVTYRLYDQDQADFYKDIYAQSDTNLLYYGRDKELSTFTSQGFGFGVGYEVLPTGWWQFDKASVSFAYERIDFKYDNFRDLYPGDPLTGEINPNFNKKFRFSADVIQLYLSVWY
jgi:hypothetical protein